MFGVQTNLENKRLKEENERLREQVETHKKEVERLLDMINGAVVSAEAHFDFKNMRVFSVERNANNNRPCTIIGYLLKEPVLSSDGEMIVEKDVVREWYLYCNEERHQQLVDQFKKVNK